VKVTGNWGFPSVPADVEQAAILTVKEWLESINERNASMMQDLGAADSIPGYVAAIPASARVLLATYRRPGVG